MEPGNWMAVRIGDPLSCVPIACFLLPTSVEGS
jgi:hypothetical protein